METRRRVPRQHAAWKGLYLIEGRQPSTEWQECEVLDISMLGLGLALIEHRVEELIGRNICVDLPAIRDSVGVRLDGIIKNARRIDVPTVRIGIEFIEMAAVEEAVATVLGALTEIKGAEALHQI
jgi:hypothetical protein